MPHVRFLQDFDYWHAGGQSVTAYKAGMEELVKQECADRAVTAGAAQLIGGGDGTAPRPRHSGQAREAQRGGRRGA